MALDISNLTISYPGKVVFENVSLSVDENEIVAIKTGILDGSTSFLKAVAGYLNNVQGKVMFEGTNMLDKVPDHVLSRIGFVYEVHGLISIYNVLQNIMLPLEYHSDHSEAESHEKLRAIMELLSIPESDLLLYPHRLNDVKTRIVNLARALITDPGLLLIDEIEGGMSDEYIDRVMKILKRDQAQRPKPIIVSTSSDIVLGHANRAFRIENRQLVPLDRAAA